MLRLGRSIIQLPAFAHILSVNCKPHDKSVCQNLLNSRLSHSRRKNDSERRAVKANYCRPEFIFDPNWLAKHARQEAH